VPRPDPFAEIQLLQLRFRPGANFWSRHPVARADLRVGPYDDISSAEVPGFADALLQLLPGLIEHRCSVGTRGGFLERLRRGTYAPHILEHVALELQAVGGDDVGFGRARGGDRDDEYTVVFGYRRLPLAHRAAELGLEIVRRSFAGTLGAWRLPTDALRAAGAAEREVRPLAQIVCAVTGRGELLGETRREVLRAAGCDPEEVVAVQPAEMLTRGLPYGRSEIAVITGIDVDGVPERYRAPDRARQLVTVLADVLVDGGIAVVPAGDLELQEQVLEAGARPALLVLGEEPEPEELSSAALVVSSREGIIKVQRDGEELDLGRIRAPVPLVAQLAGAAAGVALQASSRCG
jgi:hypothetical protein